MGKKLSYEYVKSFIESYGHKLLSTGYKGSHGYLDIQCPENHVYKMQFYNYKNGHRCPKCAVKYKADKRRTSVEDIRDFVENVGYKLISEEYKSKKIIVKCPVEIHPQYEIGWAHFKFGSRCNLCYHIRTGDRCRLQYEYVKNYIESVPGYKLLSEEYKNNRKKLQISCDKKHIFKMRFNNFKDGQQRCPKCSQSKMFSEGEKEVLEYIKTIYVGKIIENDRTIILNNLTGRNLELDIWLPDLNVAIEYNGLYWHSLEDRVKIDNIKIDKCKDNGMTLMIIMENEWQNNSDEVKRKIKGLINCLHPSKNIL